MKISKVEIKEGKKYIIVYDQDNKKYATFDVGIKEGQELPDGSYTITKTDYGDRLALNKPTGASGGGFKGGGGWKGKSDLEIWGTTLNTCIMTACNFVEVAKTPNPKITEEYLKSTLDYLIKRAREEFKVG